MLRTSPEYFYYPNTKNKIQEHLDDIRDFNASQVFEQERAIREATDALKLAVPLLAHRSHNT